MINSNKKAAVDALYELTELEITAKKERAIHACVKVANFPFIKSIDDFDFSFQPSVNKQKILDLATLRFIDNNENILFIGTSGVGKTHLATSIGIECAKKRYSTYFISFHELITQLKKALHENRLEARLKHFSKYKVLIIDEIGYLPIDLDASNLFFQLMAKRYEKRSTIITTNSPFSKWPEIFGSPTIANAILDRLLHHIGFSSNWSILAENKKEETNYNFLYIIIFHFLYILILTLTGIKSTILCTFAIRLNSLLASLLNHLVL